MADVFRSYTWRSDGGHVLGGHLATNDVPEWYWNRVAAALEIQTKDHIMLSRNKQKFHAELQAAEVPVEQFHYNARDAEDPHKAGHRLESRALLVIVACPFANKKYSAKTKTTALHLLADLVRQAAESRGVRQVQEGKISFNMQVASISLASLLLFRKIPLAQSLCACTSKLRLMMGWSKQ